MTISLVPVTGSVVMPDGSAPVQGVLTFALLDNDTEINAVIVGGKTSVTLSGADIPGSWTGLWRNTSGAKGTTYRVSIKAKVTTSFGSGDSVASFQDFVLGTIQVGTASSYTLAGLLATPVSDAADWARQVRYFATRPALVTWAANNTPAVGTVIFADGVGYEYLGTGTVISDLTGYTYYDTPLPDHFKQNATPGATDMTTAIVAAAAASVPPAYLAASSITHPAITTPVTYSLTSTAGDAIRIGTDGTELAGGAVTGSGGTILTTTAANTGLTVRDMTLTGPARLFSHNLAPTTNGLLVNATFSNVQAIGSGANAVAGWAINGNANGVMILGGYVSNMLRGNSGRDGKAVGVAGNYSGSDSATPSSIPTNPSQNIGFFGAIVDGIKGYAFDNEDNNPNLSSGLGIAKNVKGAVVYTTDNNPVLGNHVGWMVSKYSDSVYKASGTGDLAQVNFTHGLTNGSGSTSTTYHTSIGGSGSDAVFWTYQHVRDHNGIGFRAVSQSGVVVVDYASMINLPGYALEGSANNTNGRGLVMGDYVVIRGGTGLIAKANSANLRGRHKRTIPVIGSVVATEWGERFTRPGWITRVAFQYDDTPLAAFTDCSIQIIRNRAGSLTTMFDRPLKSDAAANAETIWTSENTNIVVNDWASGDKLTLQINGNAGAAIPANTRGAMVEIEFVQWN